MAEKEKQHYVPKFYLRRFSYNGNQKQIGVFNINNLLFIQKAALKTQAYKPFFYGKDGEVEDALSEAEGASATLIRKITDEDYLPIKKSPDHLLLVFFVILSQLRNPVVSKNFDQSIDDMIKISYGKAEQYKDIVHNYDFGVTNSVTLGLSHIQSGLAYSSDLEYKLLKNTTKIPFITSDNPIIKYNQFLEGRKWHGGLTGFATIGLQYLLPLDSSNLLLFYDPWIYRVGNRNQKVISITDKKEIEQINLLNFLNCEENIFFNHQISEQEIRALYTKSKKFERANQVITKEYKSYDRFNQVEPNSFIIATHSTDCKIKLNLFCIKLTVQAKAHQLDNRAVQLRKLFWKINHDSGR